MKVMVSISMVVKQSMW